MIAIDEDLIETMCVDVCTRKQMRCPACKLYQVVQASALMRQLNVTAAQAIDLVQDAANQAGKIVADPDNRYSILGD